MPNKPEGSSEMNPTAGFHFVLVHGACHGAWCWYKFTLMLEAAGHRATAVDLAGCGAHPMSFDRVDSFRTYSQPLMEIMSELPDSERVVLVGHSLGGVAIAMAAEAFPEKVSAAVYLAAFAPAPGFTPDEGFIEFFRRTTLEDLMDSQISVDEDNFPATIIFGKKLLASKLYQNCSPEVRELHVFTLLLGIMNFKNSSDIKLATLLMKPSKFFMEEWSKDFKLTSERFGSVARVYIYCKQDVILNDLQDWIIEKASLNQVVHIEDSDHMTMLSKPHKLLNCLLEIAHKYS